MKIETAFSVKNNVPEAVKDLQSKLNKDESKLVIYFASSVFDPEQLAAGMAEAFTGVKTVGCTTSGEIYTGMVLKDSIVALSFGSEAVESFEVASLKNIKSGIRLLPAADKFRKKFNAELGNLEPDKYFGIVLIDGLSGKEEKIMDELGNLTDITFIGGSAGDDLKFNKTYLFNDNEAFTDGALLILVKPKAKFGFIKTQSFKVLETTLLPTKVDEEKREVLEFNNVPAVKYYSSLLNTSEDGIQSSLLKFPVGLVVNGDPYVRSPQAVNNGAMKFYCNIKEGVELNLLESGDIVGDTRNAIKNYLENHGNISAILNFNCILRTLELEESGRTEEYGKVFTGIPTVGFSTYGEEYIGHINQTAAMLVLE